MSCAMKSLAGEIKVLLVDRFIKDDNGLMQEQKFVGNVGFRLKNRLSS